VEDEATLAAMYQQALAKLPGKPSLMLSFSPLLLNFSSDFYVDVMTKISGNVPNFGTIAVDHTSDYHEAQVLLNGQEWKDRFAVLLFHGPVKPVFYVGNISGEKIFTDKSVITAAKGNRLQMVNGVSAIDYLLSLGLAQNEDGSIAGMNAIPLIVDYNDGTTSIVRSLFKLTPEGYAVCSGDLQEGATLSIGRFDEKDIVVTARRVVSKALATEKHQTLLMYSCIGRYFFQGYDATAEFRSVLDCVSQKDAVYLSAYAGSEICPVYDNKGDLFNRNHNHSFIVCGF
ncbi:MAG: FIST C-terminal domain-containing protein, partial [Clostridiales bacterium]|jgi:hypothetical protein|nr:FIST C-terminal domain-containing protein [Clostridiales bacterium]